MRPLLAVLLAAGVLGVFAGAAQAAVPTRISLSAPAAVELGEEIVLDVTLVTADGQPVAGERLELRQVGAVGERTMAGAVTDARGRASFAHREFMVAFLTLRVAFAGTHAYEPSLADVQLSINGIEPQSPVVMSHAPGPLVKGTLFFVLGSVWLTYVYAASRVIRVRLDMQKGGRTG